MGYPNDQGQPSGAMPVRLVNAAGNAFYTATGGGGGGSGPPYAATPKGYQQIASSSSLTPLLTVPSGATYALISTEGSECRWRDDGTSPTTTVGMPFYAGGDPQVFSGNLATLRFISVSGATTYNISYYE